MNIISAKLFTSCGKIAITFLALAIAGCARYGAEYSPCPPITVVAGAERIAIAGLELGQVVRVKFNGVYGQCIQYDGYADMTLMVNLLMKRNIGGGSDVEEVPVYVTASIVDADDQVVLRQQAADTFYFGSGIDRSNPAMTIYLDVPQDHRVVIGFGRKAPSAQ